MSEQKAIFSEPAHGIAHVQTVEHAVIPLSQSRVYLRLAGDFRPGQDWASFSYSLDGVAWSSIGQPVKMQFDYTRMFMGSKFAIFNYATKETGGYVDVENFDYSE